MSRRFLVIAFVCVAGASPLTAEDLPGPEYRASFVCSRYVPMGYEPRLVLHAIDTLGDPIPGADATVSQGDKVLKMLRTDGNGRAVFESLPVGSVRLEVAMDSFVTVRMPNLRLMRGCTTATTAPLEIGGVGAPEGP